MNVRKRVKNIIKGVAFAIIFAIFAVISCKVAVHSSDTDNYLSQYGDNREYGYDRVRYLQNHGRYEDAEKAQIAYDAWMIDEGFMDPSEATYPDKMGIVPEPQDAYVPDAEPIQITEPEPVAAEPEPADPDSPAGRAAARGLPAPPDINISDRQYVLVNTEHQLDATDAPAQLAYLNMTAGDTDIRYDYDGNRQVVDSIIAQPLIDFAQGCKAAGLPVYLSSGYRSYDEQSYLFNRKLNQGYSFDVAKTIVAYPGTSEHQTGLCCDITDYYHELKDDSLENTDTFRWLNDHCAEYGFILRYPKDKSGGADTVTGCIYEPWHFRYVGTEAAQYIKANNLCLEEFWELYA